jgi:hypothetical protein
MPNRNIVKEKYKTFPNVDFGDLPPEYKIEEGDSDEVKKKKHRDQSEEEAARDLNKPFEQLIADAHDELLNKEGSPDEHLLHANKRIMSLTALAAIENRQAAAESKKSSEEILKLTKTIKCYTIVIAFASVMSLVAAAIDLFFRK